MRGRSESRPWTEPHLELPRDVAEAREAEDGVRAEERVNILHVEHAVAGPPTSPRREVTHHVICGAEDAYTVTHAQEKTEEYR